MKIKEIIQDILFDAYDIRNTLQRKRDILSQPKDNNGSETTLGDCLDNIIERLEELDADPWQDGIANNQTSFNTPPANS